MDASVKLKDIRPDNLKSHPYRLAIVTSHPIQYFGPLFRRLAQRTEIDLTVLYCSLRGATPSEDGGFGLSFAWDIPLLEGYKYKALKNYWPGRMEGFLSCLNPGVIPELKTGAYDAVIVFGWGHFTAWLAFAGARVAGIPWMLYGDSVPLYESEKGWLKRLTKKLILGLLFENTGAFLVTGAFNRIFYQSYSASRNRCFSVPLAVDNTFFRERAKRARQRKPEIRAMYGIDPEVVLVLFVGKLVPWKRPQDLLLVLRNLRSTLPQLAVAFAGEGQLRPALEAYIAKEGLKNAFVLGFKNQTELPSIYAMADVFALPSMVDCKPLVVNEAMACGLPVVVSDKTGVWGPGDIVRNGENGFVYPCGDTGALADAMRRLTEDPELRGRMGRRSLEIIRGFGYEKAVDGILRALDAVASPRALQAGSDRAQAVPDNSCAERDG